MRKITKFTSYILIASLTMGTFSPVNAFAQETPSRSVSVKQDYENEKNTIGNSIYSLRQVENKTILSIENGSFKDLGNEIIAINNDGEIFDRLEKNTTFIAIVENNQVTFFNMGESMRKSCTRKTYNAAYFGTAAAAASVGVLGVIFALPTGGLSLAGAAGVGALIGAGAGAAGAGAAASAGCFE